MMYKKMTVFVFLLVMTCAMAVGCRAMEETLDREDNQIEENTTREENTSIEMPQNNEQGQNRLGDDSIGDDLTTEQDLLENNR